MTKAINLVLGIFILFAGWQFSESIVKFHAYRDYANASLCLLFFSVAVVLAFSLNRSPNFKRNLVGFLISLSGSVLIVELSLGFLVSTADLDQQRRMIAARNDIDFDVRDRFEVVENFRRRGERYYPTVHPGSFLNRYLMVNGKPVLPLSGIAGVKTLMCNESGTYVDYFSDEYGFNNPTGSWSAPVIDAVFVGDSFTQGNCVFKAEGFVDRVREHLSHTLNLGIGGNGPLIELATLEEYLTEKRLRYVFWMYYEGNDLKELWEEKSDALLGRYLAEKPFSQNIVANKDAINRELTAFVEKRFQERKGLQQLEIMPKGPLELLRLPNIKAHLKNSAAAFSKKEAMEEFDLVVLREILAKAKLFVQGRGGELVFVYLPEFGRYNDQRSSGAIMKEKMIELVRGLGVNVLDMDLAFRRFPNPRVFFPFELPGHYNAEGNRMIAAEIKGYLLKAEASGQAAAGKISWQRAAGS
ncbi:MAG: hypothetical protein HY695_05000 [Deltaproteobacteria bacterium]|nr:hypothetical protein [Deltaproteobacteria bacterium]